MTAPPYKSTHDEAMENLLPMFSPSEILWSLSSSLARAFSREDLAISVQTLIRMKTEIAKAAAACKAIEIKCGYTRPTREEKP